MTNIYLTIALSFLTMNLSHSDDLSSWEIVSIISDALGEPGGKQEIAKVLAGKPELKPALIEGLRKGIKNKIEPSLPLRIDEYTDLHGVFIIDDLLRYNYSLSQEFIDQFGVASIRDIVDELAYNEICSNALQFMAVSLGIKVSYFYYGPDNNLLKMAIVESCV